MFHFFAIGQKKGDNTIIVNSLVPISKVKEVMFEKGYTANINDSAFFTTDPKHFEKGDYSLKIMIHRTDSSIVLKCTAKLETEFMISGVKIKYDFDPVDFRTSKSHIYNKAFNEMKSFAELLSPNISIVKM